MACPEVQVWGGGSGYTAGPAPLLIPAQHVQLPRLWLRVMCRDSAGGGLVSTHPASFQEMTYQHSACWSWLWEMEPLFGILSTSFWGGGELG